MEVEYLCQPEYVHILRFFCQSVLYEDHVFEEEDHGFL